MSLPLLAVVAAAALLVVLVSKWLRQQSIKQLRGPPSPSTLFGHERAINSQDNAGDLESEWLREYGPTYRIGGNFGTDILMTADPKGLQHILHTSGYNYTKRASSNFLGYLITGPGIIVALGSDHQRHRKIMNPAFSAAQLRTFLPLFQRITSKMISQWKGGLSSMERTDIVINKWLSRAALDIIGEAAFDYEYRALDEGETSPIGKAYDNIFKDVGFQPPAIVALFNATWDYIPIPILKLANFIPANPFTRMRNLRGLFTEYGKKILQEQSGEVDAKQRSMSKDVMSILFKANASADPNTRLADEEIMAEMFSLTLGGHETTSATLTYLMYELAQHPDYQARMRTEIQDRRALVTARGDTEFTIEDLDSLTLTVNAIKETLRFHLVVSQLMRVATKDDVIPLSHPIVSVSGKTITEVPIQAGQVIYVSLFTYHRLKDVWGEDADIWNPDRFLRPETGKHTNVGVFANLMSFGAGVRACIGWRFSIIEMQAILAEIIENLEFSLPEKDMELVHAPAGLITVPMLKGKPGELGSMLPLRVSLV